MTLDVSAVGLRCDSIARAGVYRAGGMAFLATAARRCYRSPPRPLPSPRASRRRSPAGRARRGSASAVGTSLSRRGSSALAASAAAQS
eukprot:1480667-Pleurochrysis_carterae.AAC.1